jgi:hypothetical protein
VTAYCWAAKRPGSTNATNSATTEANGGMVKDDGPQHAYPSGLLVPGESPFAINDRGGITGQGFDQTTGAAPAFLAVPKFDQDENETASAAQIGTDPPKVILPDNVRKQLQQRRSVGPFGLGR